MLKETIMSLNWCFKPKCLWTAEKKNCYQYVSILLEKKKLLNGPPGTMSLNCWEKTCWRNWLVHKLLTKETCLKSTNTSYTVERWTKHVHKLLDFVKFLLKLHGDCKNWDFFTSKILIKNSHQVVLELIRFVQKKISLIWIFLVKVR